MQPSLESLAPTAALARLGRHLPPNRKSADRASAGEGVLSWRQFLGVLAAAGVMVLGGCASAYCARQTDTLVACERPAEPPRIQLPASAIYRPSSPNWGGH